jgi:ribose transport system permease protein
MTAALVTVRMMASRWRRSVGIWVATGALFFVSAMVEPQSLGRSALAAMWPFAAILALVAIGQTLVVQQRGIDLSVPGFISMTVVLVTHYPNGDSGKLAEAILIAYGISIAAGLFNSFMVAKVGITPIVQTLGMNAALYGIDLEISKGTPTQTTSALQGFASRSALGIPMPLVFAIAIVVVVELVVKRSGPGRRFEACGVSATAGRAAGLRGNLYQVSAYVSAAILYCTAGVLLAGVVSQPDPFQGDSYLLPSVVAVVLGGTSLLGGVGSPLASVMGAIFLSQLQQLVLATGASAAVQNLVQAGALAIGITVYGLRFRQGAFSRKLKRLRGEGGLARSRRVEVQTEVRSEVPVGLGGGLASAHRQQGITNQMNVRT